MNKKKNVIPTKIDASTIDAGHAVGQIEKKIAESMANVLFTVHDPELYSEILLVKDGSPYLKTHIVVPAGNSGNFLAMKPKDGKVGHE